MSSLSITISVFFYKWVTNVATIFPSQTFVTLNFERYFMLKKLYFSGRSKYFTDQWNRKEEITLGYRE